MKLFCKTRFYKRIYRECIYSIIIFVLGDKKMTETPTA